MLKQLEYLRSLGIRIPYCLAPWMVAYVQSDGRVRPCCVHPPVMGNTNQESLENIWNGSAYQALRKSMWATDRLAPICQTCNDPMRVTGLSWYVGQYLNELRETSGALAFEKQCARIAELDSFKPIATQCALQHVGQYLNEIRENSGALAFEKQCARLAELDIFKPIVTHCALQRAKQERNYTYWLHARLNRPSPKNILSLFAIMFLSMIKPSGPFEFTCSMYTALRRHSPDAVHNPSLQALVGVKYSCYADFAQACAKSEMASRPTDELTLQAMYAFWHSRIARIKQTINYFFRPTENTQHTDIRGHSCASD